MLWTALCLKCDNLDEMDKFLERHTLPKLTQEKVDYLNKSIFIKEIKAIFNNLSKQEVPGTYGFTGEF